MRKIFFLGILLALFGSLAAVSVWAIPPYATSSQNPWVPRPTKTLKNSNEATERARVLNSKDLKATPPGLLRQKTATPAGKLLLLRKYTYRGTISGILSSSQSFTLSTNKGPKVVQTNEETKFFKSKFKNGVEAGFASLKVGDQVVAVGQVDEEGLMTAKIVIIIPTKEQIKRRAVYGVVEQKVASDSATVLTLRHPNNQKISQVVVTSETIITGKGLSSATVDNIQIGNRVVAVGTVDETGKITAKRLHIIPGLARGLFGTQPSTPSNKPATPPGLWKRVTGTPTPTVTPPTLTPTPTPSGA